MKKFFFILIVAFVGMNISAQVKWYSFEEAIELNKKEPRKFMIDVYTDWCGWCKVMDKNTFNNEIIAKYLNEKYYPVKLNAEQRDTLVFKDKTYKYVASGNRGVHEFAYALLGGNMSYPSVVFLDEKYNGLTVEKGYIKAQRFDMILKFIGDDHYKSDSWETWSADYSSPIPAE
jgi:thioredoxin-related protein